MNKPAVVPAGFAGCMIILAAICLASVTAPASTFDTIGLTLLRNVTLGLDGTDIPVAQVEANTPAWQVNPAANGVALAMTPFTYYASNATTIVFPNPIGAESVHGDHVAAVFYGLPGGVLTNVPQVDNYEAGYFFFTVVPWLVPVSDPVVNQSFNVTGITAMQQQIYDTYYDNYAAQAGTLFVSAVGNGGPVNPPSTCYNGIAVGAYNGATSTGPTPDNARAKPDISAPADATSFSTPLVSGAAALLIQAGTRGDGGSDLNAATDIRTIKALLLNGAVKPADWSAPSPSPLDPVYGAGVLNIFNSYKQLTGGKRGFTVSTTVPLGAAHPPAAATGTVSVLSGWDFNNTTSTATNDGINHYYFNLTNAAGQGAFTGTMTLAWNRQPGKSYPNNLDLFLYNTTSGALVGVSTSRVDNVEHIYISQLPQGRYDLQVLKHGGLSVSATETYALAFEYFALPLTITPSGNNTATLTWPIYPAGFILESTPNLVTPISWSPVNTTPIIINNQNTVVIDTTPANRFYRVRRP
ncbi:MAG: Fibronectin type domain protein [Pedosphaera sp.]|nr:Fibronectin type domain protein [Pedosphaera sp.]